MDKGVAVVMTAGIGALVASQAPINSKLGFALGTWQAVFVSFVLGAVALGLIVAVAGGGFRSLGEIPNIPPYYYLGGLIGVLYVAGSLVAVRSLGAGGITVAVISGQLTMAVIIDHLGLLGVSESRVTLVKVLGICLLASGTYLVIRD